MLSLLISLIIVGLIVWLVLWGIAEINLPEPFAKVAKVLVVVFAILYLVNLLAPYAGGKSLL